MTQAKINRQKYFRFNYPHRTSFLIFLKYAPYPNNHSVPPSVTFHTLASFSDYLRRATLYLCSLQKQKASSIG